MENFEDLKGYEGLYKINKNGVIYSLASNKFIKTTYDKDGYSVINLYNGEKKKNCKLHRLLAIQFIPNDDPNKTEIDHIDRNRSNNCLENLRWSNRQLNCRNRIRYGCISVQTGFRKNGEAFTNYRGSYTIPDENGKMKIVRKASCLDRKIIEDWLEDLKNKYP